ncbi:MAG: PDZ domain-containing protein, partial [Acidimicrobiia bacterium]
MRRVIPVLLLIVSACAAQPPERAALPDVGDVLPEPLGCQLSVGTPMGVSVVSVIDGTVAEGTFEQGDVITGVDGQPTESRPDLTEVMETYRPGDMVEFSFTREGSPQRRTITLGTNPTDASRAMIGVTVETAFEKISPEQANDILVPSPTARPIQVGKSLLLLDPLANAWQQTGIVPPSDLRWVSTSAGLYSMTDTDPVGVLDLITGNPVADDGFQGWRAQRLIGAVDDHLLVMLTAEIPDQPGFINVAIAGFDPTSAETIWVTPISLAFGIPVSAFGSPDDSVFVAIGADPESGERMGIALYDANGTPLSSDDLTGFGEVIGWFDAQSIAFRSADEQITVYDFTDQSTASYTLPQNLFGAVTAAVGDGRHILAVGGRDLLLQDLTDPNFSAPLASNCT